LTTHRGFYTVSKKELPATERRSLVGSGSVVGSIMGNSQMDASLAEARAKPQGHIPPDSAKVDSLLPVSVNIRTESLYFVDRDDSMKELLELHYAHYRYRRYIYINPGRGLLKFPLMHSIFGMGKSTFSVRYLALVEKFVQAMKQPMAHSMKWSDDAFVAKCRFALTERGDASIRNSTSDENHYSDQSAVPPTAEEADVIQDFFGELKQARTLYVKFDPGSLFSPKSWLESFRVAFRKSLQLWGITVPDHVEQYSGIIDLIPKPVFIVLDEIGEAFIQPGTTIDEQRKAFYRFVEY
jgi:hypothetical protein